MEQEVTERTEDGVDKSPLFSPLPPVKNSFEIATVRRDYLRLLAIQDVWL